jgi:carboxymethylenebutenolidase
MALMTPTQPSGYLAIPPTGQGSAVLVLHAWWGLNETTKTVCTRLAKAGFVAFAPDLYRGQVTDDISEAERLAGELFEDLERARADVTAAADFLAGRAGTDNGDLAIVGFSLGAFFALDLSVADPRVRSVVVFYGTRPGDYGEAGAAYLGHFAETDPFEPPENIAELAAALEAAGRPATFHHYDGTSHWFFEPDRSDAYDEAAARLAWERTLAFLRGAFVF